MSERTCGGPGSLIKQNNVTKREDKRETESFQHKNEQLSSGASERGEKRYRVSQDVHLKNDQLT